MARLPKPVAKRWPDGVHPSDLSYGVYARDGLLLARGWNKYKNSYSFYFSPDAVVALISPFHPDGSPVYTDDELDSGLTYRRSASGSRARADVKQIIVWCGPLGDRVMPLPRGVTIPFKLVGGSGDDTLAGGDGDDTIIGGDGDDDLAGERGTNVIDGGSGKDTIHIGRPNSTYIVTSDPFDIIHDIRVPPLNLPEVIKAGDPLPTVPGIYSIGSSNVVFVEAYPYLTSLEVRRKPGTPLPEANVPLMVELTIQAWYAPGKMVVVPDGRGGYSPLTMTRYLDASLVKEVHYRRKSSDTLFREAGLKINYVSITRLP